MAKKTLPTKIGTAASKAVSVVRSAPITPKTVLIGAGVLVGGYVLFTQLKRISDLFGKNDPNTGGGNVGADVDPGKLQPGATITNTQAHTLATVLLKAMAGFGQMTWSDFEEVKKVLRGKNAKDYQMISAAFGHPRRSIFTGEGSVLVLGGEQLNLSQWIALETTPLMREHLNMILPTVF